MADAIRFQNANRAFYNTLKKRIDEYFQQKNISKYGNAEMYFKTAFMLALYFVPYIFILSNIFHTIGGTLLLYAIMGFGMSGIGLSVMHDANHGSYSRNPTINKIMSYSMNLLGGSSVNWQVQHNVLHHTYTNIHGHDEDIAPKVAILRFSPHTPYRAIHRYQYLYVWFFYSLMTLFWSSAKDFRQLKKYQDEGLLQQRNIHFKPALAKLITAKVAYFAYVLALPLYFSAQPWWAILLGFVVMNLICGFTLAIIFQSAHVVPMTDFPLPNEDTNTLEDDWASHQLRTTANFAPNSWFFGWFVGGLNFQVEHHLFPNICHVHYRHISSIVEQTAHEFNLPYYSKPTFAEALVAHTKLLIQLGKQPATA